MAIVWVHGSVINDHHRTSCQTNEKHDWKHWALIGSLSLHFGKRGLCIFELS
jgi:hypothetical protein